MTAKHLIDGVMRATHSANHRQVSIKTGIEPSTLHRLYHRGGAMNLATFDLIQRTTGLSLELLMAWYRQPEGEVLELVKKAA